MVRILGFHPRDPGSTPGRGIFFLRPNLLMIEHFLFFLEKKRKNKMKLFFEKNFHHTVIPPWIYQIPSELWSQAGLGLPSTVVGDHTGIVGAVCFFLWSFFLKTKPKKGPTGIWTRVAGFKVQSDNRYTIGPKWRIRASIPVPRACKARTLPIELIPQHSSATLLIDWDPSTALHPWSSWLWRPPYTR